MLFSFHRLTCNAGSRVSSPHLFSRFSWNGSTTNEQRHIFFARAVVFFVELWAAGNNITIPVVAEKQRNNHCRLVILERSISLHHLRESRDVLRVPQVSTDTNFKMLLFVSVHARALGGDYRPMDRPCTNINSEPDEMTRRSHRSIDATFFQHLDCGGSALLYLHINMGAIFSFLCFAQRKLGSYISFDWPTAWVSCGWGSFAYASRDVHRQEITTLLCLPDDGKHSFFVCLCLWCIVGMTRMNLIREQKHNLLCNPLLFPLLSSRAVLRAFKFPSLFFLSLSCPSMGDWVNNGQDL